MIGKPYIKVGLNSIERNELRIKEKRVEQIKKDSVNNHDGITINFLFSKAEFLPSDQATKSPPSSQFDVSVATNKANKPFIGCEIFLTYDTAVLGSNPVANGVFNAALSVDLGNKGYSYSVKDVGAGKIMMSVTSQNYNQPNLLDTLSTLESKSKTKLFQCKVSLGEKMQGKLMLRMDYRSMQGCAKYYDQDTKSVNIIDKVMPANLIYISSKQK